MPVTKEQEAQVRQWMGEHAPSLSCPVCGKSNFAIAEVVMAPVRTQGGGMAFGGPSVPEVQVVCTQCACILHFAAVPLGLA